MLRTPPRPDYEERVPQFGSRVIRDRLGASCSDASTTALSPDRGAASLQVNGSMLGLSPRHWLLARSLLLRENKGVGKLFVASTHGKA